MITNRNTKSPDLLHFRMSWIVTYVVDVADVADVADVTDVADADNAFHLGISIMETSQRLKQIWCPILTYILHIKLYSTPFLQQ